MKLPGTGTIAKLIIPAVLSYALFVTADAVRKLSAGEEMLVAMREQAQQLRRENEALRREILSADDDEVLAAVARERFGLVLPDEKVFYDPSP